MSVYLVRHAKAGQRAEWDGDDRLRPLSARGRAQAAALAARLAPDAPRTLVSSPFVRCVQTLEPLGRRVGRPVETDDRLAEAARLDDVLALIRECGDGAVLCTHGDVVPEVVEGLVRRGMDLQTSPDWRKATIWVLELSGSDVKSGRVEPPPVAAFNPAER